MLILIFDLNHSFLALENADRLRNLLSSEGTFRVVTINTICNSLNSFYLQHNFVSRSKHTQLLFLINI